MVEDKRWRQRELWSPEKKNLNVPTHIALKQVVESRSNSNKN